MKRAAYRSHAGGKPVKSDRDWRHAWNAALMQGGSLAREALEAEAATPGFGEQVFRFRAMVCDLAGETFPVEASSARHMAKAWLILASTWAHPTMPAEARTACAAFLLEGVRCLDRMLSDLRTAEAQGWMRRLGEREED